MAQTLDQIMSTLNPVYQPQIDAVNTQVAALPGQQAADQAALDATKTQSFNDITNTANARGVLYSGVPISEQSTYLGTKYLPSVANLKNDYATKSYNLTNSLNTIKANEMRDAQSTQSAQVKAEADAAYKQQQLQLAQQRNQIAAAKASRVAAPKAPSAAELKQQAYSNLADDVRGGLEGFNGELKPYYTENTLLPQLVNAYAPLGLSAAEIKNYVYNYRKATYGS